MRSIQISTAAIGSLAVLFIALGYGRADASALDGSKGRQLPETHPVAGSKEALRVAKCAAPKVPELVDLGVIVDGGHYFADVAFDERNAEWQSTSHIDMPLHHASRLERLNIPAFPAIRQFRHESCALRSNWPRTRSGRCQISGAGGRATTRK
jgi:hypothetical protein